MAKKNVSFSQMSQYNECQYKWYLNYVKGLASGSTNIHLIFGSSMHTVMQSYLKCMYEKTVKEADALDLNAMLQSELKKEFTEAKKDMKDINPASKEELMEFYADGVAILEFFKKHRDEYFSKKGYSLAGIELPLVIDLQNNIQFKGYIDIIIKDEIADRIKIIDFKTSTNGWKDYAKKDPNKTAQLVLYKKFFSEAYNIPIDKIDVEFIILKRKLYENMDFPQKRFQRFSPSSGTPTLNSTTKMLNEFVETCFTSDGQHNTNREFPKTDNKKRCEWCDHLGKHCKGSGKKE